MQQLKEKKTAPAATPPEVASVSPFFWVGILLMVAIAAADLLLESRPMHFIHVSHRTDLTAAKLRVAFLLLLSAGLGLWVDRGALKYPFRIGCVLAVLAILMAVVHVATVDTRTIKGVRLIEGRPQVVVNPYIENWQRKLYMDILNAWPEPARESVPHIYRPLPYGFTRVLELASSDWGFACLVYRAFFDFWLLWASYRFVLFFSTALRAWLALGILLALYPFSICYYWGQLTDPMSHAFFVLGLLFIVQDNWLGLLVAVFAGVLAKETAMVLVIAYLAVHWRKGLIAWVRTGLVGLGAVAAFLAARLPLGWRPGADAFNGLSSLMITTNLGIGTPVAHTDVPLHQEYVHVALFIGLFIPAIVWRWRQTDSRLKVLYLTLTPLVFLSSLCFSWLYESRNYVPLLPIELAIILGPSTRQVGAKRGLGKTGRTPTCPPQ